MKYQITLNSQMIGYISPIALNITKYVRSKCKSLDAVCRSALTHIICFNQIELQAFIEVTQTKPMSNTVRCIWTCQGSVHVMETQYSKPKMYLDEMVQHKACNASTSPLRMSEDERDIGLIVLHIWHHEGKPNHESPEIKTKLPIS